MIVELAGLPGSGKSTIARALVRSAPGLRRQIPTPDPRAAVRNPMRFLAAAGRGLRPGAGWPAWPRLWLRHASQTALDAGPSGVLLLEEGIIHHTWRSLYRHPGLAGAPWRELLTLEHPVVVLTAPREVRRERLVEKSAKGRVNRELLADQDGEAWDRAEQLFEEILAALSPPRRVARVDTTGSPEEAAARVSAMMTEWEQDAGSQRQQAQAQR